MSETARGVMRRLSEISNCALDYDDDDDDDDDDD